MGQDTNSVAFVESLKRQWVAMIDAMVDPMMIIDQDYNISKCNKATAKIADSNIKEVLGQKCYKIFAKKDAPCKGCPLAETIETKKPTTFNLEKIRGKSFYEVSAQPLLDDNGNLTGIIHMYRDRTKAKDLEAQLLQSEKLASIGLLAGGIAHEINNPLGGILIFSQMLMKEMPKDSTFYEDVTEIESAAQRCKVIVEQLLDFARQQPTNQSSAELEEVDIIEAMKSALRFARVSDSNMKVVIEESWLNEGYRIKANRNKFIQIFLNLIQNAYHAMPDGGTLSLSSFEDKESSQMVFEVRDTGVGISKEDMKNIFDPFFTTKDPGEGTGLGLAICYGIAQDFDGTITVESEINEGSAFQVRLPL